MEERKAELEQINNYKTFRALGNDELTPKKYKRISYIFVFDVKIVGHRKA